MSWETIEQNFSRTMRPMECRMRLQSLKSAAKLWITLPRAGLHEAGFQEGDALGLQIGSGPCAGRLRLFSLDDGRQLKKLGHSKHHLTVCFNPPAPWHGFICESTPVEPTFKHREIFLPVPWDFSATEADEQELAA